VFGSCAQVSESRGTVDSRQQATIPSAQISFEHTVFLAVALARGDQLKLGCCRDCNELLVMERLPLSERRCHYCAKSRSTTMKSIS
jgi:hypothetical protein